MASFVAARAGATRVLSDLVNEGGGIHVDGLGTVLLTETVQLDPGRNPGLARADVEAEMARTIGATTCIWLPRGLTRDYDEFGTRGHVDIVATFASPGVVLLHWQGDPAHPDHEVSVELEGLLSSARDARGEPLEVVRVPAPTTLEDDGGPVDWSYINHLVVNGGVVACTYDDPQDADSLAVLERAYAGRRVVGVDARAAVRARRRHPAAAARRSTAERKATAGAGASAPAPAVDRRSDLRLLLGDAVDAAAAGEQRPGVDADDPAPGVRPLEHGERVGVLRVVEGAGHDAVVDDEVVDVGPVDRAPRRPRGSSAPAPARPRAARRGRRAPTDSSPSSSTDTSWSGWAGSPCQCSSTTPGDANVATMSTCPRVPNSS